MSAIFWRARARPLSHGERSDVILLLCWCDRVLRVFSFVLKGFGSLTYLETHKLQRKGRSRIPGTMKKTKRKFSKGAINNTTHCGRRQNGVRSANHHHKHMHHITISQIYALFAHLPNRLNVPESKRLQMICGFWGALSGDG